MATALAAQLAQIAASSKSTLDLKAQKAAHSKSLIFEPRIAAAQSYQSLYSICREGFDELCRLDARFAPFSSTLFSEQSRDEDRNQMTVAENDGLDKRIDLFLRLVGSRLLLMPAIRAVEWLVRRFRVHEHNTSLLISTFLPYHGIQAFATMLSILPSTIPQEYHFLQPYIRSAACPPRAVLVHQAIHHPEFFSMVSGYTLRSCGLQLHHSTLLNFWGSLAVEAVNGMMDSMRSGRGSIQRNNDQVLLQQIIPILKEGLVMSKVPPMLVACYTIILPLVSKGNLDDQVITAIMEQLVEGWTPETRRPGLLCLATLANYKSTGSISRVTVKALRKVINISEMLADLSRDYDVDKLACALCLALIDRTCRKGDSRGLPIVESIVSNSILNDIQLLAVSRRLLTGANTIDDDKREAKDGLSLIIIRLSQSNNGHEAVFSKAIAETGIDIDDFELRMGTVVRPKRTADQGERHKADSEPKESVSVVKDFEERARLLKKGTTQAVTSCLSSNIPDVFSDLCSLFLSAVRSPEHLTSLESKCLFKAHNPFSLTFLIRIWCGPYPALARMSALGVVTNHLKTQPGDYRKADLQCIVPYCIAALSDPSKKVRRAAADLILMLGRFPWPEFKSPTKWGHKELYDGNEPVDWTDLDTIQKLLGMILTPSLEECVLNAAQIETLLQTALSGGSRASVDTSETPQKGHLSHSTRLAILTFLARHTIQTTLVSVKIRLLRPLTHIKSVSGTTRTSLLIPVLRWWESLSLGQATDICQAEHVDISEMDQLAVDIALPNDKAGLDFLLQAVESQTAHARPTLRGAIFSRLESIWPSMKMPSRQLVAEKMIAVSQLHESDSQKAAAPEAAGFLQNVELTTEILLSFLDSLQTVAKMATEPPSNKRRRTSSADTPSKRRRVSSSDAEGGAIVHPTTDWAPALKQATFVLELIKGSEPRKHPALFDALFNTLSELQHFRTVIGAEHGYLQNLVLGSLLDMMDVYKNDKSLEIDPSGGYGDLLVSTIQKSSSPDVQKKALHLVADLANIAPALVLQSVMPLFTFMGSSVLRQNDSYSARIVDQVVKEVVPPLIESLRKGKKSPVAGASELLQSFVTAFEHIPALRRRDLFIALAETLNAGDFLFALLAMLVAKYGPTSQVLSFSGEVLSQFTVEVQMQSLIELVSLIGDILKPAPNLATILLGTSDDGDRKPAETARAELDLLPHLLSSKYLAASIGHLTRQDDMEAANVRELYATLLKDLLSLVEALKSSKALHERSLDSVSKLLNLLSIDEFIKSVETFLDGPDAAIRLKVLQALEVRIEQENQTTSLSRTSLLAFLPQLTAIIRISQDLQYKHVAVRCVGKIAKKYGKKDPDAVTAAATTIAGDRCLGQADKQLRIAALQCLASLVDVLQDGILSVVSVALPKSLAYIEESIRDPGSQPDLHNACYAFITALVEHLPYMLSGKSLDKFLGVSSASAGAKLGAVPVDARLQCLQLLAKQNDAKDAKPFFSALEANWAVAADNGFEATKEFFSVLGLAIDKHAKSTIAKNVTSLSTIFMSAFDLRRVEQSKAESKFTAKNLSRIEDMANDAALRMVYKLSNAVFRPVFSQLMDWATSLPKTDVRGRHLRLQSIFSFLLAFFGGLKSVVTSYASYILDAAANVLVTASPKIPEQRDLWKKTVATLTQCFEHDQDDFWQAPAHFSAIAPVLLSQFSHASSGLDLTHDLVPAVVELASAADSQEHLKELNAALLKHLRSESASIRLAAVRCEQKLTERLGDSPSWLDIVNQMWPYISELQVDDDDEVERETHRWKIIIEGVTGESADTYLQ